MAVSDIQVSLNTLKRLISRRCTFADGKILTLHRPVFAVAEYMYLYLYLLQRPVFAVAEYIYLYLLQRPVFAVAKYIYLSISVA